MQFCFSSKSYFKIFFRHFALYFVLMNENEQLKVQHANQQMLFSDSITHIQLNAHMHTDYTHNDTQSELSLSSVKLDGEGEKFYHTLQAAVRTYQFISHFLLTLIITALFMSLSANLMGTDTLDC